MHSFVFSVRFTSEDRALLQAMRESLVPIGQETLSVIGTQEELLAGCSGLRELFAPVGDTGDERFAELIDATGTVQVDADLNLSEITEA